MIDDKEEETAYAQVWAVKQPHGTGELQAVRAMDPKMGREPRKQAEAS